MSSISAVSPVSQETKNLDLESTECSICYNPINICKITLACKHVFHQDCLTTWTAANNNCPMCRRTVELLEPETVEGIVYLARFLSKKNDFPKAYEYIRKAHSMNKDSNFDFETQIAIHDINGGLIDHVSSIRKDNPEEALRLISFLIKQYPADANAKAVRGGILRDLDRAEEALLDVDSALRLEPENIVALGVRWGIYHNLGKLKEAVSDLSALLKIQPDYQPAIVVLQELNDLIANADKPAAKSQADKKEVIQN